jgi:class 3 adenylate cyclase
VFAGRSFLRPGQDRCTIPRGSGRRLKERGARLNEVPVSLPCGTLTFVFTDVEGSTRLFQTLGRTDYRFLLEDHRRLLRSAFAARGGVMVETVGDSCLAVFTGVSDALVASLDAQLALGTRRWVRGVRVRVRMGIHTGEARPVGGGYVTLALHQGARIMAAAHGGQMLVSEISCQLVAADFPVGIELACLGEYRFKDFEAPQRIFQLCHPSLPAAFPPLRASRVIRRNLAPAQRSSIRRRPRVRAYMPVGDPDRNRV